MKSLNCKFFFYSSGSLSLYDAADEEFRLIRMLPNTVAAGAKFGSHVLSVSEDSLKLAFIGPSEYTVTVANARSLDEVRLFYILSVLFQVVSD